MIYVENLKKSFQGKLIFEHVDLEIPKGQIIGLYGKSGIGKSTLAKVLCGVTKPDAGTVRFGEEVLVSTEKPYNRKLGMQIQMVYQQPYSALDPNQKLLDGFVELIRYHHLAKNKEERSQKIEALMKQVGLSMDILNHLPHQISGGEAQRISIARCLLFQPKVLILDEATSMLDVSTQANVIALLRKIVEKGSSLLFISHDKELVYHLCSKIYVFEDKTLRKEEKEQ